MAIGGRSSQVVAGETGYLTVLPPVAATAAAPVTESSSPPLFGFGGAGTP